MSAIFGQQIGLEFCGRSSCSEIPPLRSIKLRSNEQFRLGTASCRNRRDQFHYGLVTARNVTERAEL